ncbi:MAG: SapC family protein [Alphaproteobacteria bacterium]|nr:SapC family protein [Alphaproteobacteria bacterium]
MTDAPASQPAIEGALPLYKKPEPINVQSHKGMGLKYNDTPFKFLAETHFVPITVGEFAACSGRYPIIFLGDTRTPVAAMGLRQGDNLFVDTTTYEMERYAYLPAFVRRYPFVAASHKDQQDRFTVCVDVESELLSDQPERPFFTEDGQPTEFLNQAIDFVRRFETDVKATMDFVGRMKELDLFDQQQATFQPRDQQGQPVGDPQTVASYWAISGEKLRNLSADTLAGLRDNTYLAGIYAHMMSLQQWEMLINRAVVRQNGGANGATPPPPPAPEG